MIIFIYKSLSVNSDWLTLFVRSKVTRRDYFALKVLLTIFSWQEEFFNRYIVVFSSNSEIFNSLHADKSILLSQSTLLTENLLASSHFSKKYILQIIRNSDSNKAHVMIWLAFVCLNCGESICQSLRDEFQNVILSSVAWY